MDLDPRDDMPLPYEPGKPEGLHQLIQRRFNEWWEELGTPAFFNGIPMDKDTAFATWMAMQEEVGELVNMVYESCQASNQLTQEKAYEETCYIINRLSGKQSFSFNLEEYINWLEYHCENARREYGSATVTITFDTPTNPPRPLN